MPAPSSLPRSVAQHCSTTASGRSQALVLAGAMLIGACRAAPKTESSAAGGSKALPSHASMMTGLYPAGHGVHENARYLSGDRPVLAERLRQAGYRTVAFVSAFTLARRFGLARGFDVYDDEMPEGQVERAAQETTDRTLAHLRQDSR